MPRKKYTKLSEPELLSRTIRTPGFSYEERFYLRSWCRPLAGWSVFASSHGHRFFPTGLLRGPPVFSQTPGARQSAAQWPCAWTTGTGPLNAWGGPGVAPGERLSPRGPWLRRLPGTVHLQWESRACVYVWHPFLAQTVWTVLINLKAICKESQVVAGENYDLLLCLSQIPWFCVYRKHSPIVLTERTSSAKDTQE